MSFDELIEARVKEDAMRTMRMLWWAFIGVVILYSPIAVLTGLFYGWKALEYFFPS